MGWESRICTGKGLPLGFGGSGSDAQIRTGHGKGSLFVDDDARAIFDSLMHISVGRGDKVLFWRDRWIHGFAVKDIAPMVHALIDTRTINQRTVQQATVDERWVLDISDSNSFQVLLQVMHLRLAISTVQRDLDAEDVFSWPCAASQAYSAQSTYATLCHGLVSFP